MVLDTLLLLILFFGTLLGLAQPWIGRLGLEPVPTLVAGAALSVLATGLIGWGIYVTGATWALAWAVPVLAGAGALAGRRPLALLLGDAGVRTVLGGQILVTGWCVGWLAFIQSQSGGAWIGDWLEHWQRAQFLLAHWPVHFQFIDLFPMPARPPLANAVTALFLRLTKVDFAHYQLIMTVFSSAAFLPAAALAQRFGGNRAALVLAVLFMVNPLFVQNTTFPWTKLQAAFFILSSVYFFLRIVERPEPEIRSFVLWAAFMAGAVLAHYSAGAYLVVMAAGIALGWNRGQLRASLWAALTLAVLLSTWFAWSIGTFGVKETLLSNSSVTTLDAWKGNHLLKVALNLRDTLVPHLRLPVNHGFLRQTSPWGLLRDICFQLYQLNLPLALGSVGWVIVLREWIRVAGASAAARRLWIPCVAGVVVIGVAVYGDRDVWGISHICLQTVVLGGLVFVAVRWSGLERAWKLAAIAGGAVDFVLGIALHFAVQDLAIDRWITPGQSLQQTAASYSGVMRTNLQDKLDGHLVFFADRSTQSPMLVLALLAAIFMLALSRTRNPAPHH